MLRKSSILFILLSLFLTAVNAFAENIRDNDKTLSPYFYVETDDPSVDALPLLKTTADVNILGVIADVTVRQIYTNRGTKPLEAVYTFPASTRAAVYALTMKINDRILKAEVQTRKQARETYKKAIEEGKSTTLLEQQRPNVFQMNVANLMPGDTIIVEMKYTELLIPEDGIYEFVYPTVVGPRYSDTKKNNADDDEKFVETPYTHEGAAPFYDFDIKVRINAGMPLAEVMSPSHKIKVNFTDNKSMQAEIKLEEGQEKSGNKDFVLRYSLSGDKIKTGLILSKGMDENFFLLMLQPPKKVKTEEIPPREYIFVLDVSGSMNGYPLDIAKKTLKQLLATLGENDLFNVLLFAGSSRFLNCLSVPATKENIDNALDIISKGGSGGSTKLLAALRKVYNNPKAAGYSRSIVILTDGYISIEEEVFDLIAKNLNQTNVFSFGIGTSVNRYLIEGMARVGDGRPFFVLHHDRSEEVIDKFVKYLKAPVLTDVKIEFNGFNAYAVEPVSIGDVFEQRPIIVYGKWSGLPGGRITVSGKTAEDLGLHVDIPVAVFAGDESNEAIKYIWARKKIALLSDYIGIEADSAKVEEVTALGLKYNLLTKYTSFVAVDYEIRNDGREVVKVKQPLAMPEGVSDDAIDQGGMGAVYSTSLSGRGTVSYSKGGKHVVMEDFAIETLNDDPDIIDEKVVSLSVQSVYPEEAIEKHIEGKVPVWALFRCDQNTDITECVYVQNIGKSNEILYDAVRNALLDGARYRNDINVSYLWLKIDFNFDAKSRKVTYTLKDVLEIFDIPYFNIMKNGTGKKINWKNGIKVKYSVWDSDCNLILPEKVVTFDQIDKNILPMFALLPENISTGAVLEVNIPLKLLDPKKYNISIGEQYRRIYLEILEAE